MGYVLVTFPAWVFTAAASVGGFGLLLLMWALFWDWLRRGRRRGRMHCPKCWYDMRGSPGLRCPECGYTAKSERQLHRSRRRWRWAGCAMVLILIASGGMFGERAVNWNWYPYVPTSVILMAVRDPCNASWFQRLFSSSTAASAVQIHLADELWYRYAVGALSPGEQATVIARQFSGNNTPMRLHARRRHPAGMPIRFWREWWFTGVRPRELRAAPIQVALPVVERRELGAWSVDREYFSAPSREYQSGGVLEQWPALPVGRGEIAYDVVVTENGAPIWSKRVSAEIDVVAEMDEAMAPVRSAEVDAAVSEMFREHAGLSEDRRWLVIKPPLVESLFDLTLGFEAEILDGAKVVSRTRGVFRVPRTPPPPPPPGASLWLGYSGQATHYAEIWQMLESDGEAVRRMDVASPGSRIRVRSSAEQAMMDIESERYWDGEVETGMRVWIPAAADAKEP